MSAFFWICLPRPYEPAFPLANLLRQPVYSRMAGYEDVSDAERLSQDPRFRLIGSGKIWDRGATPKPRLSHTGWKDGGLNYTEWDPEVQNGNSQLYELPGEP